MRTGIIVSLAALGAALVTALGMWAIETNAATFTAQSDKLVAAATAVPDSIGAVATANSSVANANARVADYSRRQAIADLASAIYDGSRRQTYNDLGSPVALNPVSAPDAVATAVVALGEDDSSSAPSISISEIAELPDAAAEQVLWWDANGAIANMVFPARILYGNVITTASGWTAMPGVRIGEISSVAYDNAAARAYTGWQPDRRNVGGGARLENQNVLIETPSQLDRDGRERVRLTFYGLGDDDSVPVAVIRDIGRNAGDSVYYYNALFTSIPAGGAEVSVEEAASNTGHKEIFKSFAIHPGAAVVEGSSIEFVTSALNVQNGGDSLNVQNVDTDGEFGILYIGVSASTNTAEWTLANAGGSCPAADNKSVVEKLELKGTQIVGALPASLSTGNAQLTIPVCEGGTLSGQLKMFVWSTATADSVNYLIAFANSGGSVSNGNFDIDVYAAFTAEDR